jgi:Asp-tRNA(Asn)/Glu-tRNA(Gln) amidotransferase A subunit family amidase
MKIAGLLFVFAVPFAQAQSLFEVAEASIADEQKAMTEGRVTSKALVQAYLNRIEAFDRKGPRLNSMITINPHALSDAEALDRERAAKGPRGPLHGIPVILKDNYGTAGMQTTAGSLALLGFAPASDAFQVKKLREAGAVIIGKSNLHELAAGITTISSAGGQTLNPYDPSRNPGGSSGGTGAAITASFAAAGMGSDTCGSIRIPSSQNNLVGLRPTKGLSSIAGIVPLSITQDVGGPLARSVADLAVMLDATIGEDPADPATHLREGQTRPRFMDALQPGALKGARIGVLESLFGNGSDDAEVLRVVRSAIDEMKKAGAETVTVPMPELTAALEGASVIDFEFKEDFANYLAQNANAPVHSLEEIVASGLEHSALEATFKRRLATKGRNSEEYRQALAKRTAVAEMILKAMEEQQLDALVYPTMRRKPARINDPQAGSTCQLSASTGFPAISMPAGFTADGLPAGVELLGRPMDDGKLVAYAYAYEQATHHRQAPPRTPALGSGLSVPKKSWQTAIKGKNANQLISARFVFNPATNELTYAVTANGFGTGEILAATIHRGSKDKNGPVILLLSNHSFKSIAGTEQLAAADREKLEAGELYLRVASPKGELRVPLKPDAQK